jgi:hypothetical protein
MLLPLQHFRSTEESSACNASSKPSSIEHTCTGAKVDQLHSAVLVYEHIVAFDVPVHYAVGVQVEHPLQQLVA